MLTDESIMEELLERATNPAKESVDEIGVQMFCMVVRSNAQLVDKALKSILVKVHSSNITEATRGVALLEEAMSKCGPEFQDEIAKFRFLNELIRLVSKNYAGPVTPIPIKKRIMECLLLFTTLYPQKTKIREVYDMLNKEGGIDHGPSSIAAESGKRDSILGKDGELFEKLIQSGDQENFKRANLLIQARLNQEVRHNEFILQHKSELKEVQNTVGLLHQMLDTFVKDGCADVDGSETMNLIRELYMASKKHRKNLLHLHELMGNMDTELLAATLETNDFLQSVLARYKNVIVHRTETTTTDDNLTKSSDVVTKSNADLLSEALSSIDLPSSNSMAGENISAVSEVEKNGAAKMPLNTFDEINDIFGCVPKQDSDGNQMPSDVSEIFGKLEMLEPVIVLPATTVDDNKASEVESSPEKRIFRELPEIDVLSEKLFTDSLQTKGRVESFKKKPERVTLNDLAKEKLNVKPLEPKNQTPVESPVSLAPSNVETATAIDTLSSDEQILSSMKEKETDDVMLTTTECDEPEESPNEPKLNNPLPNKHLTEITIDLDDIVPTAEEHILLNDDEIKVTLSFTENRPSKHVSVIVISVLNKSKMPIKDFQFEASAKKPSKVRLLPPSNNVMPPYKPFRPLAPINQMMLLLNPTGKAVDLTCIVSYKFGDDPDPITESIVAKDIPYVE